MRRPGVFLVALAALAVCHTTGLPAQSLVSGDTRLAGATPTVPRVRSEDPTLAALLARAYQRSTVFRELVDAIDQTDGLVYVEPGRCGRSVRTCMPLTVTLAGPSRLLRILVDPRAADCGLMASIGHELRHAVEVLQQPSITSDAAIFFFYAREGRHAGRDGDPLGAWETRAAVETGVQVLAELRQHAGAGSDSCPNRGTTLAAE